MLMQLYCNVQSERASKGQGGNKYLDIDLLAGKERAHVLRLLIENKDKATDKYGFTVSKITADGLWVLYQLRKATREAIDKLIADAPQAHKKEHTHHWRQVLGDKNRFVCEYMDNGINTGCGMYKDMSNKAEQQKGVQNECICLDGVIDKHCKASIHNF